MFNDRVARAALFTTFASLAAPCLAAGWTAPNAEVRRFYPVSDSQAWLQLDSAVAVTNVNGCSIHNNWFFVDDLDTNRGKLNWSMLELAFAMRHRVTIFTSGCDTSNAYNLADYVRLDKDDN